MKLFKKNDGKKTEKLPMSGKVRKGFRFYCTAVMALTLVVGTSVTAFAANDPIAVVNNLSDFISCMASICPARSGAASSAKATSRNLMATSPSCFIETMIAQLQKSSLHIAISRMMWYVI